MPSLNLQKEVKHLCMRYGEIKQIHQVKDYSEDEESFTEVFHVTFTKIQSARFAKHMIDDKSFFGGILHVCYAPELESVSECRHKLDQRRHEVLKRLSQYTAADLRKSQQMSQSTIEPQPGPSGTNVPAVTTAYPAQHCFSSPQNNVNRFKKPTNQHSTRKGVPLNSTGFNSTNKLNFRNQKPQKQQPPRVLIGPQLLPKADTKPPETAATKPESNPVSDADVEPDKSQKQDKPETVKRTKFTMSSKFIPPQVKRIKFN
ncbi:RNA-binding protein 48 isoform X2 [Planococcus citri]